MDTLPTDIVYVCIEYLNWKEYYKICKHMGIDFRFNVYFRNTNQKINIDVLCLQEEEYLEIIQYLYSINSPYTQSSTHWASKNGHLDTIKFLHSIGAPITSTAFNWACEKGHLEVIKFLHSINVPHSRYAMNWASKNGHLEVVKFLQSLKSYKKSVQWGFIKGIAPLFFTIYIKNNYPVYLSLTTCKLLNPFITGNTCFVFRFIN